MSFKAKENVYTCPVCRGYTTTIDVDEGVTPMFLRCRATGKVGDCPGMAISEMYPEGPRPAHIPPPAFEWYRPSPDEVEKMDPDMQMHLRAGGLELRARSSCKTKTEA